MKYILFRCDASHVMGSGHIIRCRNLARFLQKIGNIVIFVCRKQPGNLISLLEKEFPILSLPQQNDSGSSSAFKGRNLYGSWLGCSQNEDAYQTLEVLYKAGINEASWIIVDHYSLDHTWESIVAKGLSQVSEPRLFVIDDLADRQHQADLLLDSSILNPKDKERYAGLLPTSCQILGGPSYAMLSEEYHLMHELVPKREEVQRVLLFFGASDPSNNTGQVLEGIVEANLDYLYVDVVAGLNSPHIAHLQKIIYAHHRIKLFTALPSLAGLIARADVAIGAASSTSWERVCLSLPSIILTLDDNQRSTAQSLQAAGVAVSLGQLDNPIAIINELRNLTPKRVQTMSMACEDLCDGKGIHRIIEKMNILQEPTSGPSFFL